MSRGEHRPEPAAGKRLVLVAAVADNGVIGAEGDIPWRIPEDLRHFRDTTRGNTVVMGRRTFESIGRALPQRSNIVLTRDPDWRGEGVLVAAGLEQALALAQGLAGDVMVIGGAEVYARALPVATHQVITEVHRSPAGDTRYPEVSWDRWVETHREPHDGYDFVWWERTAQDPARP
ncbi:MAG: dihydrofolate reductase [Nocardioidaceae bacterium]